MATKDGDRLPSYDEATEAPCGPTRPSRICRDVAHIVHIALFYSKTGDRSSYTPRKYREILLRPVATFEDFQRAIKALWQAERGALNKDNAASWFSWFFPSSTSDQDRIVLCERTWPELRERILHAGAGEAGRTSPRTSLERGALRTFAFNGPENSVVRIETRLVSTSINLRRPRDASEEERMECSYRNNERDLLLQGRVVPKPKNHDGFCALQ